MISVHRLYEINPAVLKQAAVWGVGSFLSAKAGEDKPQTEEEKKKLRKKFLTQGLIGAAAGAAGSMI